MGILRGMLGVKAMADIEKQLILKLRALRIQIARRR